MSIQSTPITDASRIVVSSDQVSCGLGDEAAIVNLRNGVYYGLDPVGARIWSASASRSHSEKFVTHWLPNTTSNRLPSSPTFATFSSSSPNRDSIEIGARGCPHGPGSAPSASRASRTRCLTVARVRTGLWLPPWSRVQAMVAGPHRTRSRFSVDRLSGPCDWRAVLFRAPPASPRRWRSTACCRATAMLQPGPIGVRKDDAGFAAHAWVEWRGGPLLSSATEVSVFPLSDLAAARHLSER